MIDNTAKNSRVRAALDDFDDTKDVFVFTFPGHRMILQGCDEEIFFQKVETLIASRRKWKEVYGDEN